MILEVPIPPIYFTETEDANSFELVDGLQRVSSVLHLFGVLPREILESTKRYISVTEQDDDLEEEISIEEESLSDGVGLSTVEVEAEQTDSEFLRLDGCEIVKALNGRTFSELPLATQRHLRYSSIRVETIRKESPTDIKYFLFKRLNRGGSLLSDQEVRNSTVRIGGGRVIDFIERLSRDSNFRGCVRNLSKRKFETKYDEELVLRFFAFKNNRAEYIHDINSFLDKYIEGVAGLGDRQLEFDYEREEEVFAKTFHVLNTALEQTAFSAIPKPTKTIFSGFRSILFETISLGVQELLPKLDANDSSQMNKLKEAINGIKQDAQFKPMITGGGKNYQKKLNERIDFVADHLQKRNIVKADPRQR